MFCRSFQNIQKYKILKKTNYFRFDDIIYTFAVIYK